MDARFQTLPGEVPIFKMSEFAEYDLNTNPTPSTPPNITVVSLFSNLNDQDLLTEQGLADAFSVDRSTINRDIKSGKLPPPIKIPGGKGWFVSVLRDHFLKLQKKEIVEMERLRKLETTMLP